MNNPNKYTLKFVKTSDLYKYVSIHQDEHGKEYFMASLKTTNGRNSKYFPCERSAAIAVDKALLYLGKDPVNILVPKLKK